ncbi:hypothetical protein C7964_11058 [Loktanella sp. PT4BL]|nr:hypothetical protein C7964_11058 [Loktanella sp. PT4BL]
MLGIGPWHQGVDVAGEVAVGPLGEEIAHVGIWFDAVHLACADEAGEAGPIAATLVGSSVMMPGVWVLTRLSRIRFTRFAAKRSRLQDQLSTTFVIIF